MRPAGRLALGVLALAAGSIAALAQSAVISARSGLIHYVEGQVYLGDQLVEPKFGNFPEVKENQQLKTEEGRAEVLLTPGVFLRVGENSSFRMITNRLIDTRLEFLSGTAIVEAEDIGKDNSVTVVYGDATVHPLKKGLYRLDAGTSELRVYDGVAEVTAGGQTVEVKEGHVIALDTLAVHKFDKTVTDALNRWSERRAGYVSMANVAAANTLRTSIFSGGSLFLSGWYWNPFLGMYSFVPGLGGMFYSPYGYPFFSPFDVYMAYMPGFYYPGYSGYYSSGYANAYNTVSYKSVPVPSRSSGSGSAFGSSGSVASGHQPSHSAGSVSAGSVSSSSGFASHVNSAPISHGGGGGASNSPHH
jgi:mannose-6-phosphate isomerase-like protein (cupin superfamily)